MCLVDSWFQHSRGGFDKKKVNNNPCWLRYASQPAGVRVLEINTTQSETHGEHMLRVTEVWVSRMQPSNELICFQRCTQSTMMSREPSFKMNYYQNKAIFFFNACTLTVCQSAAAQCYRFLTAAFGRESCRVFFPFVLKNLDSTGFPLTDLFDIGGLPIGGLLRLSQPSPAQGHWIASGNRGQTNQGPLRRKIQTAGFQDGSATWKVSCFLNPST